ncbi:MAG: hypothetical protein QF567_02760 [Candidatus Pacearchaeota archaeon]|jgi:hypothetical protein|nr:hypothetical protein [Candidatus Pacearchaeota archaeon]|tara:strand:+ start:459 stop:815 length:357 start_codon:yes stop_codon:yes gene_type:complete
MGKIEKFEDGVWIWFRNTEISGKGITGKYLFFSDTRKKLIYLAKKILKEKSLPIAKVNIKVKGKGFVLCVYDTEPKLKNELKEYADFKDIHYRYWKSDEDTSEGKYSDEFLNKLPPKK